MWIVIEVYWDSVSEENIVGDVFGPFSTEEEAKDYKESAPDLGWLSYYSIRKLSKLEQV